MKKSASNNMTNLNLKLTFATNLVSCLIISTNHCENAVRSQFHNIET